MRCCLGARTSHGDKACFLEIDALLSFVPASVLPSSRAECPRVQELFQPHILVVSVHVQVNMQVAGTSGRKCVSGVAHARPASRATCGTRTRNVRGNVKV